MKDILLCMLCCVGICLMVWGMVIMVSSAETKRATVECLQLSSYASISARGEGYPGFYVTKWQAEQCKAVEVIVDAPITN